MACIELPAVLDMLHTGWQVSSQLIQAPSSPAVRKVSKGENVYNDQ